ncbi:MAG: hypothetical protein J3K34DRAFT_491804 [Monoraphidium minutum]|nr:MAG: hypothetical protein J3K34DRAFT_491804 [Monoraphidium minutum]
MSQRPRALWLCVAALLAAALACAAAGLTEHQEQQQAAVETLRPHEPLLAQLIALDSETKRYRLAGLKPSTSYELRLSYPASIPAAIRFEWDASGAPARRRGRRLLDVEKLDFRTDAAGGVPGARAGSGGEAPVALLRAARRSVHRDGPRGGATHLVFDLVLAEVWLGLPADTLPVVGAAAALLLAVAAFVPFWSATAFPALLAWVAPPQAAAAAGPGSGAAAAAAAGAARRRRP